MNLILDLLLIGILALGAFLGMKKGVVKAVEKPLKPLLSITFACTFARAFAAWAVEPIIGTPIFNWVEKFLYDRCVSGGYDGTINEIPTLIKVVATLVGVDLRSFENGNVDVIAALAEKLTLPVVNVITTVISFLLLLVFGRLVLALLFAIVNKVLDIGALKILNRVLGVIVCVFFSVFMAWGVISMFDFLISLPSIADIEAVQNFTGGVVYRLFKEYSLLELLFSF